jgi:hypothetical protein
MQCLENPSKKPEEKKNPTLNQNNKMGLESLISNKKSGQAAVAPKKNPEKVVKVDPTPLVKKINPLEFLAASKKKK